MCTDCDLSPDTDWQQKALSSRKRKKEKGNQLQEQVEGGETQAYVVSSFFSDTSNRISSKRSFSFGYIYMYVCIHIYLHKYVYIYIYVFI